MPGHERFVKNLLAGAAGIDLVLLVVAADEGVMPQTREHLAILELLGVQTGIVVITKTDLVEAEMVELVEGDIAEALAGTFLATAPRVRVSAQTGQGLAELRRSIAEAVKAAPPRPRRNFSRLPVDRALPAFGHCRHRHPPTVPGGRGPGPADAGEIRPDRQLQVHGAQSRSRTGTAGGGKPGRHRAPDVRRTSSFAGPGGGQDCRLPAPAHGAAL